MTGYEKWFLTMNMTIVASFNRGNLQGPVWRMLEENGFLVANNLEMNGKEVLYIYPGFQLGLFGHFEYGKMVDAQPVYIEGNIPMPNSNRIKLYIRQNEVLFCE